MAWLERKGLPRPIAAVTLAGVAWLGGVACLLSGKVFNGLDFVTANIMLPLGGLLIAIFVGWAMRQSRVKENFHLRDGPGFTLWYGCVRVVAPIGIGIIFVYSLVSALG